HFRDYTGQKMPHQPRRRGVAEGVPMQFLTSLFGGSENMFLTAGLALAIVLVLILIGLWVLKLFLRASTTLTGGRNRRLFVVDSVTLDSKRQLLIVRRDNVEHVILTGGPQDL